MEYDSQYMRLALEQAEKGQGRTAPNPCVGAVIVKDDQVVGCGYHRRAGTPHAEINAIAAAGDACVGATIYVTLEPCNHTGRTPPCSRAVLAAGLQRVVIGMADPHPVASGGADFLRSQGLAVKMGLLERECRQLN
ncbi:MAG: bifunctional diaminohydroxyphosphoribosylaminopyrimidine deaminase/5-amino-6-(5-phosphoribosylamino)uracil reductase RibD, partial [Candidatus Electrothrix sp. AR3]|nr:bifunctional diaminohydroxyphosphoribosylaminopyrimidine deaminase/5-amino-6-(5-phosphoribosylamino)uracil reductase RibD [Candidatus Electrothrix sp. AR3]